MLNNVRGLLLPSMMITISLAITACGSNDNDDDNQNEEEDYTPNVSMAQLLKFYDDLEKYVDDDDEDIDEFLRS